MNARGAGRMRGTFPSLCALLLVGLAACSAVDRPWTTEEFFFNCWSGDSRSRCNNQPACRSVALALEAGPATLEECLAVCDRAGGLRSDDGPFDGCDEGVVNIERSCEQYCRRKFR